MFDSSPYIENIDRPMIHSLHNSFSTRERERGERERERERGERERERAEREFQGGERDQRQTREQKVSRSS